MPNMDHDNLRVRGGGTNWVSWSCSCSCGLLLIILAEGVTNMFAFHYGNGEVHCEVHIRIHAEYRWFGLGRYMTNATDRQFFLRLLECFRLRVRVFAWIEDS